MSLHGGKQVRLEVKFATPTMLKVLWVANLSKGNMSIETAREMPEDTAVVVTIVVAGRAIEFPATVRNCSARKDGKGYFVQVGFELDDQRRTAFESIVGTVHDVKREERKKSLAPGTQRKE